ncbi:hypothetical protein GCM10028805_09320 [Spirosoma harenae]
MKTITQFATLALAITLSIGSTLAQQPVKRTTAKPSVRPYSSTSRPATTQANKPAATAAPAAKPQTQTQAQPAQTQAPAPVAARPAESRPQPVSHSAPTRPRSTASYRSHKNVYVNLGVGLATYYGGGFPVGVSVEADVKNNFSVGGSIDYYHYNYGYYSSGYNFAYFGARASYHLAEALNVQSSSFDPYIGASLGFRYAGSGYSDYYYTSSYNSGVWVGLHLGARFMFSPKVGAFTELGYGVSAVKLGLTAKF